jgi:hypothetical protein
VLARGTSGFCGADLAKPGLTKRRSTPRATTRRSSAWRTSSTPRTR